MGVIMKTKFTPGPWGCVYTSNHSHDYLITRPNKNPLPLRVLANDHSEQLANARLIAAAPEMFDIIKELLNISEEYTVEDSEIIACAKALIDEITK